MKIDELSVFVVLMEGQQLARDTKKILGILTLLEEEGIPFECSAVNIDWIAVVILKEYRGLIDQFVNRLKSQYKEMEVSIDDDVVILTAQGGKFDCRSVGMLVNTLSLQQVEVKLMRQMRSNTNLVIGVTKEQVSLAKQILMEGL